MQGIYKIENLINGKCYVGQSVNIKARWTEHRIDAKGKSKKLYKYPLYQAIRKYGLDSFDFSVVELVAHADDLTRRELYWYNKLKPEYNQMIPESISPSSFQQRPIYKIDMETLNILDRYDSIQEASRENKMSAGNITMACKGQRPRASGYYWCYVDEYDTWQNTNAKLKEVPVVKLDKDTHEQLAEYPSITEAAKQNNLQISNIWTSCNYETRHTGGFKWAYKS